ncbi:MAG: tRNA 2-thiouridine(34) synthase MnmA [Bacteroidota bacterium]
MSKRVVVGLSGGVDSSVAAHLLLQQGYEVIGIFMRNWHDESVTINNECPWIDDSNDAMLVAEHLGIPFQVLDLSAEYRKRIVDYMFAEYEAGRTPNPDVLCNREIKFDVFLKAAMNLGADYVATGHYCRRSVSKGQDGKELFHLLAGVDETKDQSYFLCQLNQDQLSKSLFPVGELRKSEVRKIAREIDLPNADKKDSQGLCFIGKVKLPVFLQQQLQPKKGKIVDVTHAEFQIPVLSGEMASDSLFELTKPHFFSPDNGSVIGEHEGAHFYTIGQRKGLGVGGRENPLFIVGTDTTQNIIYVAEGENHPALNRPGLFIKTEDVHWINPEEAISVGQSATFSVRIRYRQPLSSCQVYCREEGLFVVFDHLQRGIAPGQFCVFYRGEEVAGSGVIS